MPKTPDKVELLQGTLDMLILKTLVFGPAHGHGIATSIQQTTRDVLTVEHGSLYPALHRLEKNKWISGSWETAPDRNREFKYLPRPTTSPINTPPRLFRWCAAIFTAATW